jgi:pimeloyl-ACP methyl ester carboxylesterase
MPTVVIDGIATRYEVIGSGPQLLMYAPGGFNAVAEAWSTLGIYQKIKLLDHLPAHFTCILFDRRECGQSGGRVEPITWEHYVAQGKGLPEHLHIVRAHLMGGCMGCAPVVAFAVAHPETVASMILYWPVGGAKYRISSHQRFAEHIAFAQENGLDRVVTLVRTEGNPFGADPRGGPWASVIKNDAAFAAAYMRQDLQRYVAICGAMRDALFDRDTAPGAEPKQLMGRRHSGLHRAGTRCRARDLGGALSRRMPAASALLGCRGRGANRRRDESVRARISARREIITSQSR